jgi:large conductance mechanosensitive channel
MKVVGEFKKFAMRGSIVDLAIGFTVGTAFTTVARSLVDDLLMPPIGLLLGQADFTDLFLVLQAGSEPGPYKTLDAAQESGAVVLAYGSFINSVVAFLIVAVAMFLIIRSLNRIEEELDERFGEEEIVLEKPSLKKCRFCWSTIPDRAVRCPHCTSRLDTGGPIAGSKGASPAPAKR